MSVYHGKIVAKNLMKHGVTAIASQIQLETVGKEKFYPNSHDELNIFTNNSEQELGNNWVKLK